MNTLNDYNLNYPLNRSMNLSAMNPNQIPMNQDMPASFRGIQGLLNLFQCCLDLAYLLNLGKTVFFDYILYFIKKILHLIKYVITLKWMLDIFKNLKNNYIYYIYQARFFKYFSLTMKLCMTFGLLSCILLKLYKSYQLTHSEGEEEKKEEEEKNESEGGSERNTVVNNEKESEERWKEYLKSANIVKN